MTATFFNFASDNDTMAACLSLIERAVRGDLRVSRANRGRRKFGANSAFKHAKRRACK